jgi:hypothetical protein
MTMQTLKIVLQLTFMAIVLLTLGLWVVELITGDTAAVIIATQACNIAFLNND